MRILVPLSEAEGIQRFAAAKWGLHFRRGPAELQQAEGKGIIRVLVSLTVPAEADLDEECRQWLVATDYRPPGTMPVPGTLEEDQYIRLSWWLAWAILVIEDIDRGHFYSVDLARKNHHASTVGTMLTEIRRWVKGYRKGPMKAHENKAKKVIEWARGVNPRADRYLDLMKEIATAGAFRQDMMGLAASLYEAWRKAGPNVFLGTPGRRLTVRNVLCKEVRPMTFPYGYARTWILWETDEGKRIGWYAQYGAHRFILGQRYIVQGVVKEHSAKYRTTILSRVRFQALPNDYTPDVEER